jgi:hypothetical protein
VPSPASNIGNVSFGVCSGRVDILLIVYSRNMSNDPEQPSSEGASDRRQSKVETGTSAVEVARRLSGQRLAGLRGHKLDSGTAFGLYGLSLPDLKSFASTGFIPGEELIITPLPGSVGKLQREYGFPTDFYPNDSLRIAREYAKIMASAHHLLEALGIDLSPTNIRKAMDLTQGYLYSSFFRSLGVLDDHNLSNAYSYLANQYSFTTSQFNTAWVEAHHQLGAVLVLPKTILTNAVVKPDGNDALSLRSNNGVAIHDVQQVISVDKSVHSWLNQFVSSGEKLESYGKVFFDLLMSEFQSSLFLLHAELHSDAVSIHSSIRHALVGRHQWVASIYVVQSEHGLTTLDMIQQRLKTLSAHYGIRVEELGQPQAKTMVHNSGASRDVYIGEISFTLL